MENNWKEKFRKKFEGDYTDIEYFIETEVLPQAHQAGIKEGQAKMNNSGRLLFQQGFKAGIQEAVEKLRIEKKSTRNLANAFETDLTYIEEKGFNQAIDELNNRIEKLE